MNDFDPDVGKPEFSSNSANSNNTANAEPSANQTKREPLGGRASANTKAQSPNSKTRPSAQTADDNETIESFRKKFGDKAAENVALVIFKIRNTPPPNFFAQLPRSTVVMIALYFGVLESADKLPQLMLTVPRYQAAQADVAAKLLQPDLGPVENQGIPSATSVVIQAPKGVCHGSVQLDGRAMEKDGAFWPW